MAVSNCYLDGCTKVIHLIGEGASFSEMIGEGEARRRVYFCSLEHCASFQERQTVVPVTSEPSIEGTGWVMD